MACPVPRSGRYGFAGDYTAAVLTRFSKFRSWTLNSVVTPETRVYSGTRFGTQRLSSFVDHTGNFSGYGTNPPLFAGDLFTFIGYTAPTTGVPCTPGCAYVLPAIVESLVLTWNWTAENRSTNWTINFASVGALQELDPFADPCDDTVYCDSNPCALTFVMKDPCYGDAVVEWCNIVSATLTFTSANLQYSNNSTNCTIVRDVGNLDWTLDVVDQNPCVIPVLQGDYWFEIKSTVTPSTIWSLKYAKSVGVSDLTVNSETADIISKTNQFAMNAVLCCPTNPTPTRGAIIDPNGVTVWPYAIS